MFFRNVLPSNISHFHPKVSFKCSHTCAPCTYAMIKLFINVHYSWSQNLHSSFKPVKMSHTLYWSPWALDDTCKSLSCLYLPSLPCTYYFYCTLYLLHNLVHGKHVTKQCSITRNKHSYTNLPTRNKQSFTRHMKYCTIKYWYSFSLVLCKLPLNMSSCKKLHLPAIPEL